MDTIYTPTHVAAPALKSRNQTPAKPNLNIEAQYESDPGVSAQQLRQQAYSSAVNGGGGGEEVHAEAPGRNRRAKDRSVAPTGSRRVRVVLCGAQRGSRTLDLRITRVIRTVRTVSYSAAELVLCMPGVRSVPARDALYRPISWLRSWLARLARHAVGEMGRASGCLRSASDCRGMVDVALGRVH